MAPITDEQVISIIRRLSQATAASPGPWWGGN